MLILPKSPPMPIIIQSVWEAIAQLKAAGPSILLVRTRTWR